jgi:hypothetical protein
MRATRISGLALALGCAAAVLGAQNLLTNPDFDFEVTPWVVGCGTTPVWTGLDEAGCPGSGSAHQLSGSCQGFTGAGVGQCVAAGGLTTLHTSARMRPTAGVAGVVVSFYSNPDCTAPADSSELSNTFAATGDWLSVDFSVGVPAGTQSLLVGFGALVAGGSLELDVDSGYAGARPRIFHDDLEGNPGGGPPVCRWSLVTP